MAREALTTAGTGRVGRRSCPRSPAGGDHDRVPSRPPSRHSPSANARRFERTLSIGVCGPRRTGSLPWTGQVDNAIAYLETHMPVVDVLLLTGVACSSAPPHQYQQDMNRRNEQRMEFPPPPYGQPQPGAPQPGQPHHPPPVQQPHMSVSQPPPGPPPPQQQQQQQPQQQPAPTPPAPQRRNKRPAPTATPAATAAPQVPPVTPVSGPPQVTPPMGVAAPPVVDDAAAAPVPTPPVKKSRTNTPWTPAEELRLKQMRDAGKSWAEIAKVCGPGIRG